MYEPYIRGQDAEINHPEIFRIEVFPDERQTALAAADFISNVVLNKPDAAISYATSNTVLPIYKSIADKVAGGEVDFSQTIAFHLDEYYPCLQNEPHSFVNYLYRLVFNPLKIPEKTVL